MTAGEPRLFTMAQEQLTRDDYYTPSWIFDAMGLEFDIDVCAPPGGIPWIPARRHFTQADDGLLQEWSGRVWMNPPYSQATPWVRRFMAHAHGVMLIVHAKSAWHPALWKVADGVVIPDDYFDFVGGPNGGSIFAPVFFAAFGDECVDAISNLGTVRTKRLA
jgi:hypothetical protein